MNDIKRYVFSQDIPEKEALARAFALCGKLLKTIVKEPAEVVIFIPQEGSFNKNLREILGEDYSKQLLKNKLIKTSDGSQLRLETHRTFKAWKGPGNIIIGIFVTEEMLDQIDTVRNASAVIIVPEHIDDVRVWMKTWNPELIGAERTHTGKPIGDPRMEEILNAIVIDPPDRSLKDRDRKYAIEQFRKAKKQGISFEPDDIKVWALQNEWSPDAANELRMIAADIRQGKRIR